MLARLLLLALVASAAAQQPVARDDCSVEPVLKYFDIRGRGEAIRIALHDAGVKFTDESFTSEEWGKERDDGLKALWSLEGKLPFGQVPLLEVDGLPLVQSHAILRYLGRKYGWYKGTPAELYKIDFISEGTEDVRKRLSAIRYSEASDAEKQKLYAAYFKNEAEAHRWLGFLNEIVEASPTDFVSGSADATHADYLLLDLLDYHDALGGDLSTSLLQTMPGLLEWREKMRERPKLKAYLESTARRKS